MMFGASTVAKVVNAIKRHTALRVSREIASNTLWLLTGHGLRMGLGLVVAVWLARYLGPDAYGTYSFTIAFVAMFSQLSALGLNSILARDIVQEPEQTQEILGTALVLRLVGGTAMVVLSVAAIWFIEPNNGLIRTLVAIYATGSVFRAFEVVDQYFQSKVQSRYVVMAKSSSYIIAATVIVSLILIGGGLRAFVAVRAGEILLFVGGLVLAYRFRGQSIRHWAWDSKRAISLLKQSWPLILSGFGAVIYLKIDQVMLAQVVNYTAVGHYAVAVQLSEIWYIVPTAIVSSIFPALVKLRQADIGVYRDRLQQLYDFLAGLAMIVALPISLFSNMIINALYGPEYAPAGQMLGIHIWASVFIFMRAGLSKWLIVEDLFIFSLVTHGAGAIVNIGLNIVLIPLWGGNGAAIATVISYAIASYGALAFHDLTRPAAKMMTRALAGPFRAVVWAATR